MKKEKRFCYGFTLVELLVVVAIMVVLGLIFTDTLIQSFRGQSKVKAINLIKQNSQVTLDKIANEIRQAEAVVCVSAHDTTNNPNNIPTDTIVIARNGNFIRYRFYEAKSTSPQANGYIAMDYTSSPSENACKNEAQLSQTSLTDQNLSAGISVVRDGSSPVFSWDRKESETGYNDLVTVKFRATAGIGAGETYENTVQEGGILFNTTIQVRGGQ